jgi:hypothetical protein
MNGRKCSSIWDKCISICLSALFGVWTAGLRAPAGIPGNSELGVGEMTPVLVSILGIIHLFILFALGKLILFRGRISIVLTWISPQ